MPIVGNGSIEYNSHVDYIDEFLSDTDIESICSSLNVFLSNVGKIEKNNVINLSKEAVVFDDDNILMNKINDTLEFYEKNKDYLKNINDYINKESNNHICDEAREVYEVVTAEYNKMLEEFYGFCDTYNEDVSKKCDYDVNMIAMNNGTALDIDNKIAEYGKYIISKGNPPEPSDNEVDENDFITGSILDGLRSGVVVAYNRNKLVKFYNKYVVDAYEFNNKNKEQYESSIGENSTETNEKTKVSNKKGNANDNQITDTSSEDESIFSSLDDLKNEFESKYNLEEAKKKYFETSLGSDKVPSDDEIKDWYNEKEFPNFLKETVNGYIKYIEEKVENYENERSEIFDKIKNICDGLGIDYNDYMNNNTIRFYDDNLNAKLNAEEKKKKLGQNYNTLNNLKEQYDIRDDFRNFCNSYIDNKWLSSDGFLGDVVSYNPKGGSAESSYKNFMDNYCDKFESGFRDLESKITPIGELID